jgi:transcriptional regulator with XRE-family HTH domain
MKQEAASKAYSDAVAAVIKQRREAAGLSMVRLSEGSGLSQPMIGLIERGIHAPTISTLFRFARTLGTTPSELLAEAEAAAPGRTKGKPRLVRVARVKKVQAGDAPGVS